MVTKVNDTVFDGTSPRVSDLDVTNFDTTNGTVQTNASSGKQIVNYETMLAGLTASVPAGVVVPFAGLSAPTDWVLCDGSSYSTGLYPALFAAIGYTYGGGGASFNVPDLRGRVPGGLDNMGGSSANRITAPAADSLGGVFGQEEITLSMGEMPLHDHNVGGSGTTGPGSPHNHTGSTSGDGAHFHNEWWGPPLSTGASGDNKFVQDNRQNRGPSGGHSHGISINNESSHIHSVSLSITESNRGSNQPHDNVQPTMFMNYIIKAT